MFTKYICFLLLPVTLMFCSYQQEAEETVVENVIPFATEAPASAAANYMEYCASCHGSDARAFADRREWTFGSTKDSIAQVIVSGLEDEGMPAFEETFTAQETNELAQFIVDAKKYVDQYDFADDFDDSQTFNYDGHSYRLELITDAVDVPWGIAQTPDGAFFITERYGGLYLRKTDGSVVEVEGAPKAKPIGQGGMLDVLLAEDFESSKRIYISYSKENPEDESEVTTAVFTGIVEGDKITGGKDIWIATPYYPTQFHFGSRMLWDNDGNLFVSIGDRGKRDINPQDLSLYPGKIHRIKPDGSIPDDNPFVGEEGVVPSIWSYGHRNPQGLAYDKANGTLYDNEHGPRGGDEINIVEPKKNYGWPVISYGINYSGTTFTEKTHQPGMEQPLHYWVPSIGVCGMVFVNSDKYPGLKGHLLSGSLKYEYLNVNKLQNGNAKEEIKMFPQIGRLRSVVEGSDGYLYVGVEEPGRVYRILPQ